MEKIMVCVADAQLYLLLRHVMANEGFDALLVTHPSEVAHLTGQEPIAAALIDWSDGPLDKMDVLATVKSVAPLSAVLILSRGKGKRNGVPPACDLMLERPFNPHLLLQFLRNLRNRHFTKNRSGMPGTVLRFADLEMNIATVSVHRSGKEVALTALQFRLLRRLLLAPNVVCERNDLIESCWSAHVEVEPRTVDIHIGHIRRALEVLGPDLIRTVRSRGYALQMPTGIKAPKPSNS